ncbi:hypothetical protein ADL00_35055 [Streptomyces sp. AS58]|nr:hypothetical protein ADL00_35055 [Streptomyces sp. AS58]
MLNQVLAHSLERTVGIWISEQLRPLAERVEGATGIPGLGDTVGVRQQLFPRDKRYSVGPGSFAPVDIQPQRQRVPRRLGEVDCAVPAYDHGVRVAVGQKDRVVVGAHLGEDRCHELLALRLAGDAALQSLAQADQVGFFVRGLPERTEHHGRRLHCGQALSLYIAHDDPDPVLGGDHLIQIAADPSRRDCRGVGHGHLQRPCGLRHRWEQDSLSHLSDGAHAGEFGLPSAAHHSGGDAGARNPGHGYQHRDAPVAVEQPVMQCKACAQDQRHQADHRRTPPAAGQSGECGPERCQGQQADFGSGDDVHDGQYHHHRHDRDRQPGEHRASGMRLYRGHGCSNGVIDT